MLTATLVAVATNGGYPAMHSSKRSSHWRALITTASLIVPCAIAGTANAQAVDAAPGTASPQSPPETGADIVVTASRISRAPVTDQPVAILGSDELTKRGYTNVGMALMQQLPAFGAPGNSPVGQQQGNFGAGQTFANMYNLGSQRTLTLVNGMRFVSPASSSIFGAVAGSPVDLSQISPSLIERVEVVSVGGAPIYGSDAIAGTINFILKKNFQGFELNGSAGVSQHGDGQNYNISALFGKNFSEGRGNITANFYYDRQYGIAASARPDTIGGSGAFFGTTNTNSSYVNKFYARGGMRYNVFTNTGMPMIGDTVPLLNGRLHPDRPNSPFVPIPVGAITNAAGQALIFNASGQLAPFKNGVATGNQLYQAGGDGFPIGDYGNFLVDSERYQGTILTHFDFTDHFRFKGEAWFSRDYASNVSEQPFYNTALFDAAGTANGNLILSTDNPFLSTADRQTIIANLTASGQDPSTFYLARANTDLATGAYRTSSDLLRFAGGFEGDFEAGERKFNWEVNATYGRSISSTTSREVVIQNYFNALNAVSDGNGGAICAPGYTNALYPTLNSTCAPLNVFGTNRASKSATDYITALAVTRQINKQFDIVADIKGDLFKLPGGYTKFVLGYEHRYESARFDPGAFFYGHDNGDGTRTEYGSSVPIDRVAGSYYTNEGFGEIDLPVIGPENDIPGVYRLDLNAAGRYVKNSMTNGFWAYTGGGTYAPVKGLTVRGNYTRSFRAPAITELFAPNGSIFDTANDPCDSRYIGQGPNPTQRAANCRAAGVPTNFTSNVVDYTAKGTSQGNRNLRNEVANSWTVGGVLQPDALPGFQLTADYVSVDIKQGIESLSLTDVMRACYDATAYPSSYCGLFTRDGDSQVTSFQTSYYNLAVEKFRGLQMNGRYQLPLSRLGMSSDAGTIMLNVNYLHTFKHFYQIGTGDLQKTVGAPAEPADNFTATIDYATKSFDWMWQFMYNGPSKIAVNSPDSQYQFPRVSPYLLVNSSLGFDVNDKFNVRFIVNNVFNRTVPFPYAFGSAASVNRYYDAIMGRYMRVIAGIKF
jgi:outer membrane receptor protein involved in Fe transport